MVINLSEYQTKIVSVKYLCHVLAAKTTSVKIARFSYLFYEIIVITTTVKGVRNWVLHVYNYNWDLTTDVGHVLQVKQIK